jgi:hypothetical protein
VRRDLLAHAVALLGVRLLPASAIQDATAALSATHVAWDPLRVVSCATPFSACAFHAVPKQRSLTQHAAWHGIAPKRRNRIADIGEPRHTSLEIAPSLPWRMIGACRSLARPAERARRRAGVTRRRCMVSHQYGRPIPPSCCGNPERPVTARRETPFLAGTATTLRSSRTDLAAFRG